MPLADDLLIQARMLATVDIGIPLQANLRRAISAAYYALFHLLISEAIETLIPEKPLGLRSKVARSFVHRDMDRVCKQFTKQPLPHEFGSLLSNATSAELKTVAMTFTQLQEARHDADYDIGTDVNRAKALTRVEEAEVAFAAWRAMRGSEEATVFLTALAFGARWSK